MTINEIINKKDWLGQVPLLERSNHTRWYTIGTIEKFSSTLMLLPLSNRWYSSTHYFTYVGDVTYFCLLYFASRVSNNRTTQFMKLEWIRRRRRYAQFFKGKFLIIWLTPGIESLPSKCGSSVRSLDELFPFTIFCKFPNIGELQI